MAIKLIAVDMDGTFLRTGHLYDKERFNELYKEMKKQDIHFVIASGNQYYQLKSFFPDIENELSFVAENGAFVLKNNKPLFVAEMANELIANVTEMLRNMDDTHFLICGEQAAYGFQDTNEDFWRISGEYYYRRAKIATLAEATGKIFKFAIHCPIEKTDEYVALLSSKFPEQITAVSSGHGDIDLIIPGVHKASGLARLGTEFNILPTEMMTFGDGGNDLEMLSYAKYGIVMENARESMHGLTAYMAPHHNENGVLEVIESYLTDGEAGLNRFLYHKK